MAWREEVAEVKRASFADEEYWGRPVPGFGDPAASVLLLGLAPAAHGANRTGRVFTGDRSGDFLFAGSIGRTDLTGGSHPEMLKSLRERVLPLADDVVVLPGHGGQTTIGRERVTNPYLADLADETGR